MSEPIYKQVIDELTAEIEKMAINDSFYSERVLATKAGISRMTARKVIDQLVEMGYLYRVDKVGSFVADRNILQSHQTNFPLYVNGIRFKRIYLSLKYEEEAIANILKIGREDKILCCRLLGVQEGKPYSLEDIYTAYSHRELESVLIDGQRIEVLKQILENKVFNQTIELTKIPVSYAKLLNVTLNETVMLVNTLICEPTGEPIMFVKSNLHPQNAIIKLHF